MPFDVVSDRALEVKLIGRALRMMKSAYRALTARVPLQSVAGAAVLVPLTMSVDA